MPPRSRKSKTTSVDEMFRTLGQEIRKQAIEPNILRYKPHSKQTMFHSSSAKVRLYLGGNRSGKTVGGITEDIYYLRRDHPFKRIPDIPIRGRIVCVDFNQGINQIIIPKLKQWLPPSLLINGSWEDSYSAQAKTLTLANGSTCELMTYEQDLGSFMGTSRHFIHYDEEPPQHIYNECQLRLLDTDGDSWLTLTPLNGMSWIYDDLYLPGKEKRRSDVAVIEVTVHDNPYIKAEAIDRILGAIGDEDERAARETGRFIQLGGLVYKDFKRDTHVIPALDPKTLHEWEWHRSMDHGFNNPTAWLWHAVSPDGEQIITFAEHYRREMVVSDHARIVKSMDAQFGKEAEFTVGDPAIEQRNGINGTSVAGTYAEHGIYIASGNNEVLTGVERVSQYLKKNPKTGFPYWRITENCTNLIFELERLKWKTYASRSATFQNNAHEQIHKKNDHAADAARYFFTMMPDLTPDPKHVPTSVPEDTVTERYDQALARMANEQASGNSTNWTIGSTAMEWD
jgi:phage terminase large subunit-like protein